MKFFDKVIKEKTDEIDFEALDKFNKRTDVERVESITSLKFM